MLRVDNIAIEAKRSLA